MDTEDKRWKYNPTIERFQRFLGTCPTDLQSSQAQAEDETTLLTLEIKTRPKTI